MGNEAQEQLTFGTDDDTLLNNDNPAATQQATTGDNPEQKENVQQGTEPTQKVEPHEQKPEEGEPQPGEEGITHDPLKDTQRAFHQKAEEVKRLREENEQLLNQLLEIKQQMVQSFKKLTPEELESLKYDDPDKYLQYKQSEQQLQTIDNQATQVQQRIAAQKTLENLNTVLQTELGIEPGTDEYNQFIHSPEFQKVDAWITQNVLPNPDMSYTADAIKAAIFATLGDKVLQIQRKKAAENVVQNVQQAQRGATVIDKASGAQVKTKRKLSDYTQEEIAQMGEDELNALLEMEE